MDRCTKIFDRENPKRYTISSIRSYSRRVVELFGTDTKMLFVVVHSLKVARLNSCTRGSVFRRSVSKYVHRLRSKEYSSYERYYLSLFCPKFTQKFSYTCKAFLYSITFLHMYTIPEASIGLHVDLKTIYIRNYRTPYMRDCIFFLRIQSIINELISIRTFFGKLSRLGFPNPQMIEQVTNIINKLRSKDQIYTSRVHIDMFSRYLMGMRECTAHTDIKGVFFYKILFESTLTAIVQEIRDSRHMV